MNTTTAYTLWNFKTIVMTIFFVYILLHAVVLYVHNSDIRANIKETGSELMNPVNDLNNTLKTFPNGLFSTFSWGYDVFYAFFRIYLWLWIFSGIFSFFNIRSAFFNWSCSIIIFILVEMLYTSLIFGDPLMIFKSTSEIMKSAFGLVTNHRFNFDMKNTADNTCTSGLCVY